MTPRLKTLLDLGGRGDRVRVYIEPPLVRVRWRVDGIRKHRGWPDTPENRAEAKAFAHGLYDARHEEPVKVRPRLTLRQLWERYAEAEFPSLRPTSQIRYAERWGKWERFLGRDFVAEDTTQENADQYRTARTGIGIAVNQIAEEVKMAKVVYAWGQRRKVLALNDLALYRFKVAKEDRREAPAEYRMADFVRILEQFDPALWGQWRPWALLTLLGYQGVRTNAARHLQWDDVDLEAGILTWRGRWDKVGKEWSQPLRESTREALDRARRWRARLGYVGPWVFWSEDSRRVANGHEPIYGHSALAAALAKAERLAGVSHIDLRGMHGLRRMVVGEIVRITGDIASAAQFIGDTDLRVVNKSYLKRRVDQLQVVANQLDKAHGEPRRVHQSATDFDTVGVNPSNREPLVGFEPTTAPLTTIKESATPPTVPPSGIPTPDPSTSPPAGGFQPESAIDAQSGVRP